MGSPLGFCTLIFDLMRNLYIYNACIYIHSTIVIVRHSSIAVFIMFMVMPNGLDFSHFLEDENV